MARKDAEKPMLPLAEQPKLVPCAADANCKNVGRMWVDGYRDDQRICVPHYYRWMDEKRGISA